MLGRVEEILTPRRARAVAFSRRTFSAGASLAALAMVATLLLSGTPLPPSAHGAGAPTGGGAQASSPPAPIRIAPAYIPGNGVRVLGRLPASAGVTVAVGFAPRDPGGLAARTLLEYTPGSPEAGRFLSPQQVTAGFGPAPGAYAAAESYFSGFGLATTASPDRLVLLVSGPSSRVAAAFGTTFVLYRSGSQVFYSHPTPAALPALAPWTGVLGLGNETRPRPFYESLPGLRAASLAPLASGCTGGVVYPLVPCEVQTAYNESGLLTAGTTGAGRTIGVVDTYDSVESQTDLARDLGRFTSNFGLPAGNVRFVYPVPTAVNLNRSPANGWGPEEALDLEWSRALAPGATIDMTLAPDAFVGLYASVDWLVAHRSVNVISLSWGEPDTGVFNAYSGPCRTACNASSDGSYSLLHPVLAAAAAEGIGVFSATGDCGAADGTSGVSTNFPASDPYVTAVSATDLTIGSGGTYVSETGWTGNATGAKPPGCQNQGGGGGGYSPFPRPAWQTGPGVPSTNRLRATPDVSLVGAAGSPVVIYCSVTTVCGGGTGAVAGTSAATPMWAGLAAVWDQKAGRDLGFLAPSLYSVLRSSSYASAIHDVKSGWNGYSATAGWDPVTGVGTPDAGALASTLSAPIFVPSTLRAVVHATPRYGVAPLSVAFSTGVSGGTAPYRLADLDFGDGNATLIAPGTGASHLYAAPGAYVATLAVFDSGGNTAISAPVAVVVGGGALDVHLSANTTSARTGAPVSFLATASGGTGPYRFSFAFGDGTYASDSSNSSLTHVFGAAGGFCATVFVKDAASPPDAAASNRVPVTVGGGVAPVCENPPPLSVSASSPIVAMDSAADLPLRVSVSGGLAPVSTRIASNDSYASACQCPILRTPGPHSLDVVVSDSADQQTEVALAVTVYPALVANFTASTQTGPAPLSVDFAAHPSGGHGSDSVVWRFGDGTAATSGTVRHTYAAPGFYLAVGSVEDRGHGNASEAFLIDVRSPKASAGLGLTATVGPAVRTEAGQPIAFSAHVWGGTAPYLVRWSLGANASAFGANVTQTFASAGCLVTASCPLSIGLDANDARGRAINTTFALAPFLSHRFSALIFGDNLTAAGGPTPFRLFANATATGVPDAGVAWSFGDGASASGGNVSHVYLSPGNFTLTEIATDIAGDRLVRTHALAITGLVRSAPGISGGPNATLGIVPFTLVFNVSGVGGAGPIYTFLWDFGDGTSGSGSSPVHTYLSAGAYLARVTVTDALGDPGTRAFRISVFDPTDVGLQGPTAPLSAVAGGTVPIALRVHAVCTALSVPGCADGAVRISTTWEPVDGSPGPGTGALPTLGANARGWANGSIPAPLFAGRYLLRFAAMGPDYRGFTQIPVTVQPAVGLFGVAVPAPALLAAGVAAGAVVAAVALGRGRGPRPVRIPRPPPGTPPEASPLPPEASPTVSPSPRPAEPGAPPGA